ncbi:MAG TPA: protein-L-isoaspartate(D-aspartate) O-methyltransferase [Flavobacteriaceae bacterium]|nr:protein-L-isoaspartate(D-aspartate) O-methyltransferase [Flavobacteriaceae bacterium]|tara:strand:+ start:294 stop:935 length:642 start_codon:yes stop_codon:yes gene_type:complete
MKDNYKFLGRRKDLVNEIKEKGITDKLVLDSLLLTPRHYFVDSGLEEHAYLDKALPIIEDQTISQPFTVAFQTQLLCLEKKQKILEIGTGSGYQCAILYNIGVDVYTIERNHKLFRKTSELFGKLNIRPKIFKYGDGYKGLPDNSPFDGIIVTAGASEIPQELLKQLKVGGRLVIPVGGRSQTMYRITKESNEKYKKEKFGNFRFVPLLKNKN